MEPGHIIEELQRGGDGCEGLALQVHQVEIFWLVVFLEHDWIIGV